MAEVLRRQFNERIKTLLHSQSRIQNLKDSVHTIRQEISHILGQKSEPQASPLSPPRTAASSPLTKEEQRKLSSDINAIPPQQLIQFIKDKLPQLASDKEIVIDIHSMDTKSLRMLMDFVQTAKKTPATKKAKPKKSNGTNGTHPLPKEASHASDSESNSGSDSESEESQSESDSDTETNPKKPVQVETVVTPVLTNVQTAIPPTPAPVPEILPTFPSEANVHDSDLTNEVSWSHLTADDEDKSTTSTQSSDAANLWSSYRDSHAQLEQKELEKRQHEEELLRAMEREEQERLEKLRAQEDEERRRWEEEKERQKQEELERQRQAELDLEEARLKAKRDRERKIQEDESNDDLLSLNSFAGFQGGMLNVNLSGELMSDLRSSLRGSPTLTDPSDDREQ